MTASTPRVRALEFFNLNFPQMWDILDGDWEHRPRWYGSLSRDVAFRARQMRLRFEALDKFHQEVLTGETPAHAEKLGWSQLKKVLLDREEASDDLWAVAEVLGKMNPTDYANTGVVVESLKRELGEIRREIRAHMG